MIQLEQCPKCLRKVYPGTRNGKRYFYDYYVNVKGEIESSNSHFETCPWGTQRDPFADGTTIITDYADILDEIQMIWKLDCAALEPKSPIEWNEVDIYHQQPPIKHLNPITFMLTKLGGPYPRKNRAELIKCFTGTVVSKKRTVVALMAERELFDKIHDFLYQYHSRNRNKKPLKQVIIAGYRILLDTTVISQQKKESHYAV